MNRDIFRPTRQPAQRFYDALDEETTHRNERGHPEWILKERERMWREARDYAEQIGVPAPSMEDIERVESSACGHIDYMAKFAYYVAELVEPKKFFTAKEDTK